MSQKLLVGGLKWVDYPFQFNKDVVINCNEAIDIGYILELMSSVLKNYINSMMIYHLYQKERKLERFKKLCAS